MREQAYCSPSAKIAVVFLAITDIALYLYVCPLFTFCIQYFCGRLEPITRQNLFSVIGLFSLCLLLAVPTVIVWLTAAIRLLLGKPPGSRSFIRGVWISIILQPMLFFLFLPVPPGVADLYVIYHWIQMTIIVNVLLHVFVFWRITMNRQQYL